MSTQPLGYPIVLFADKAAWAEWLNENHATERGVWMRIAKTGAPLRSVGFADALDVALCYGWIDGQRLGHDEESYLQKFTPRGKKSTWSKRNREHVARLIASGEMRPPGLAAVEAAKADGRWERAYDSPADAAPPDDLLQALAQAPKAKAAFEALKQFQRFAVIYRIQTAVRPETRARRIREFVARLERGEPPIP